MSKEHNTLPNTTEVVRKLLDLTKNYYGWAAAAFITSALAEISFLTGRLYLKDFFDYLSLPADSESVSQATYIVLYIFGLELLGWTIYRASTHFAIYYNKKLFVSVTTNNEKYLLRHSYRFFSNDFSGSLVKKLGRLPRAMEGLLDNIQWRVMPMAITIIFSFFALFAKSALIAWALLCWLALYFLVVYKFAEWKQKYEIARSVAESVSTGILSDQVSNSDTVRLFANYDHEYSLYQEASETQYKALGLTWTLNDLLLAIQGLMMISVNMGIMLMAIRLWRQGILSIGDFVVIQAYLIAVFNHIWEFGRTVRQTYSHFADAAEAVEILNRDHEICDVADASKLTVTRATIDFKRVSFWFNKERPILDEFDLTIPHGQHVAFVGPSGAGKSTLIKLILRLYGVKAGEIFIDGKAINKITQDSLRTNIALVPQDPSLFHRSLMENIRYGNLNATDEEVINAAKAAHCDIFINHLAYKYDTLVGERGIKLSGGERQRVAIARAILKNAPILILDEATSSLDSESEMLIQDALDTLMRDKTTLVIAHRLSTIMKMDRIVVIDEGKIVADGSHSELLSSSALYKKLWDIQAGGFLP